MSDFQTLKLAKEMLELLARFDCQFWACRGPKPKPEDMITCMRCRTMHNLSRRMTRLEAKIGLCLV